MWNSSHENLIALSNVYSMHSCDYHDNAGATYTHTHENETDNHNQNATV